MQYAISRIAKDNEGGTKRFNRQLVKANLDVGQWLPDYVQELTRKLQLQTGVRGGVLFDLIHEIDAAEWILGDLEALFCITKRVQELKIETEAVATSVLVTKETAMYKLVWTMYQGFRQDNTNDRN